MQVREGKPSQACRNDGERFCFCGRVGDVTPDSDKWKYLCGTCKVAFKLDRTRVSGDNNVKANRVKPKRLL